MQKPRWEEGVLGSLSFFSVKSQWIHCSSIVSTSIRRGWFWIPFKWVVAAYSWFWNASCWKKKKSAVSHVLSVILFTRFLSYRLTSAETETQLCLKSNHKSYSLIWKRIFWRGGKDDFETVFLSQRMNFSILSGLRYLSLSTDSATFTWKRNGMSHPPLS